MVQVPESIWPWLRRLYWNTALLLGAALALPLLGMGGWVGQLLAGAYLLLGGVGFALAQRYPQAALLAHLAAVLGLLVWGAHQPWAAGPGWDGELVLYLLSSLSTLALVVLALFGGFWPMVAGLVWLAVLLPHPTTGLHWLVLPLWGLAGLVGLALHRGIGRLEAAWQELSQTALWDRQTGLSTRLALEADYARYQALASRSDQPLLLSLWVLHLQQFKGQQSLQIAQRLAQLVGEATRQGDGLYRLDDRRFCGLHIGLVSGHELTERLSRSLPQAQVVWVVCNGLPLEEALRQAQNLLHQSALGLEQAYPALPKA